MSLPTVIEAYYTPGDLAALWRFSERKIRDLARAGEFTTRDQAGQVTAEPLEIAGEIRIPASGINAFAARNTYAARLPVKARSPGELRRKAALTSSSGG